MGARDRGVYETARLPPEHHLLLRHVVIRHSMLHRLDSLSLLLLFGVGRQQAHGSGVKKPAGAGGTRQAVSAQSAQSLHQAAAGIPEAGPATVLRSEQHHHQLTAVAGHQPRYDSTATPTESSA